MMRAASVRYYARAAIPLIVADDGTVLGRDFDGDFHERFDDNFKGDDDLPGTEAERALVKKIEALAKERDLTFGDAMKLLAKLSPEAFRSCSASQPYRVFAEQRRTPTKATHKPLAITQEIDRRAKRYMSEHCERDYSEAVRQVLEQDRELAERYAAS